MESLGNGDSPLPELVALLLELHAHLGDGLGVISDDHEVGEHVVRPTEALHDPFRSLGSVVGEPDDVVLRPILDQENLTVRALVDVHTELVPLTLTEVGFRRVPVTGDLVVPHTASADDELLGVHSVALVEPHQHAVLGVLGPVDDVVGVPEINRVGDTHLRERRAVHPRELPARVTGFKLGEREQSLELIHVELGLRTELQVHVPAPYHAGRRSGLEAVLVGGLDRFFRRHPLGLLPLTIDILQTLGQVGDSRVKLVVDVHVCPISCR